MKNLYIFILISAVVINFSCKSKKNKVNETVTDAVELSADSNQISKTRIIQKLETTKSQTYTEYNLPLPIEIFKILDESESNFSILNTSKSSKKYEETVSKAYNLGIYSTDLAYSVKFHNSQYFSDYFNVVKKLSDELELGVIFDNELINRVSFNKEDTDSLKVIAEEIYLKTCRNLEENEKINIMPFVVIGGWIESVYIFTQSVDNENITDNQKAEIVAQREVLKNLNEYLYNVMTESNTFYLNLEIQNIVKEFDELENDFKQIDSNTDELITNEQFKIIKNKIYEIRKLLI